MKRNVLLFISLCVVGCVMTYAQQMPGLLQKGKADTQDCKAWVDEQLSEMSLKEKIGQLFIHTVAPLQTQRNKNNIYAAIKEYKVGGLLFSGGQLSDQVLLTNYAQSLAEVPLLITFDGEWGLAMRLKGTPRFPRNRVLGCIQDNELLYEYGKEVARQCKEIGVQINFAPVADVDVNPRNPVINTRSFGGDPRNVAQKVVAYARGLEDGGVLSVCKHFPGHGDTEVDSHLGLPSLNHDLNRLKSTELVPFQTAINNGVDMVMTAHIMLPQIDKEYPATMSKKILTDLLRDEMGYKGVIITDDLDMQAISKHWDLGEAAIKSVEAGADILLVCHTIENQQKVYNAVVQGVNDGKIDENRIDESVRRILRLKYQYKLSDKANNPTQDDINNVNGFIYESIQKYNSKVVEAMYK